MDPQQLYDTVELAKKAVDHEARRFPVVFTPIDMATPTGLVMREPASIVVRDSASSSTCAADDNSAQCAKPVSASTMTLPIALGVT